MAQSVPADTPPVSTVPQPPAPFAAPTTTAAKIDSCSRDHGRWSVTYSWQYIGGASWTPLGSYKSLGSGRYQDNMLLKNGSSITTVQVVDPSGSLHTIALNPALSTNNC